MKTETVRIGVFICECGPNIGDALDLARLVEETGRLQGVAGIRQVSLACNDAGREAILGDIRRLRLDRLVLAGCTPKEHEATFRKTAADAGLNPYLLQVVNIREQCAWVISDKQAATDAALRRIRAAVRRVAHHEPIEQRHLACNTAVLVIGAGVAGIGAARTLAEAGRDVVLVEKSPCLGGKVARFESLYPDMACASCRIEADLDAVLHHERIRVITCAEVSEVTGFLGNFNVTVNRRARLVDESRCLGCGLCVEACPVSVPDEWNGHLGDRAAIHIPYAGALPNVPVIDRAYCRRFAGGDCAACREVCAFGAIDYDTPDDRPTFAVGGIVLAVGYDQLGPADLTRYRLGQFENVLSAMDFERMLNSSGPTGGEIRMADGGVPERITFLHCCGSRSPHARDYCSGICCLYLTKFIHQVKEKLPKAAVVSGYTDFCLPGKEGRHFFNTVADLPEVRFVRVPEPGMTSVLKDEDGLRVVFNKTDGHERTLSTDMVVLAPAVIPAADTASLADLLDLKLDGRGFVAEPDALMAPTETNMAGVWAAGCVTGPADIAASVARGRAAAGQALSRLREGVPIPLEPMVAEVTPARCSGCRLCIGLCEFRAIRFDPETECARIEPALCRGCGVCGGACPANAILCRHFTDEAIGAEIRGLLEDV